MLQWLDGILSDAASLVRGRLSKSQARALVDNSVNTQVTDAHANAQKNVLLLQ